MAEDANVITVPSLPDVCPVITSPTTKSLDSFPVKSVGLEDISTKKFPLEVLFITSMLPSTAVCSTVYCAEPSFTAPIFLTGTYSDVVNFKTS